MDCRRCLAVVGVSLCTLVAGCLGEEGTPDPEGNGGDDGGGTGTETGDESETDVSPGSGASGASGSSGDVEIVVRTAASDEVTVQLTVYADKTVFFEATIEVPPDGGHSVDPGIHETGRYELEVAVDDGPDESYPFGVEEYDLRMESDLIVAIGDDDVRVMIEE